MDPAELFAAVAGRPLPQAAVQLAAEGVPVFPCVPGGKRPLVEHGFHEATTDPAQVASWWRRWPAANLGVPTGQESGLEVVDVDHELAGTAQPHVAAVDAKALRDFLDPRPEPSFHRAGTSRVEDAQRLAGWVSALGEGERNRGLFWAACRLAEAGVAPSVTLDALGPAAAQIGLPPREVVTTIRSAYRATSAVPARTDASAPGHGGSSRRPVRAEGQVLS